MNEQTPEFNDKKSLEKIAEIAKGLVYMSETDSVVEAFFGGPVREDDIRSAITQADSRSPVEEFLFEDFFGRLSSDQDWYNSEQKKRAEQFAQLKHFLAENLRGLKVFKVGHIQLTIYAVGVSESKNAIGVKMDAVET